MNDSEISELVQRLGRSDRAGGIVIERAAIQAAGADFPAVIDWILSHSGKPEQAASSRKGGGLHGSRMTSGASAEPKAPVRFVLPASALN